jgi:hypothetical protein
MQVGSVNVIPQSANHMIVSLNGTIQKPNSSFTVSGSTITFASNLVTNDVIDFIQILGDVLDLGVPSDATVTTAKVADGAITSAKLADDAVTAAKLNNDIISGSTELASEPADTDEFLVSDAGTIKRIDYSLIKGGGAWNLLSTTLADNSGRVDCTLSGSYGNYAIVLNGIHPASDNVQLQARMSTASTTSDGGSNYRYVSHGANDAGNINTYSQASGGTFIKVSGDSLGNASGESLEAVIYIGDPTWTEHSTRLNISAAHTDNANRATTTRCCGVYDPTTAVTQINFLLSSGNIQYGIFKVYGIS